MFHHKSQKYPGNGNSVCRGIPFLFFHLSQSLFQFGNDNLQCFDPGIFFIYGF